MKERPVEKAGREADGAVTALKDEAGLVVQVLQGSEHNREVLFRLLEMFPYSLKICAPDGLTLFANSAARQEVKGAEAGDGKVYSGRRDIIRVQAYMEENWKDGFDVKQLARIAHMSVRYFQRLFKHYTGETPYDSYRRIRIKVLKEKLSDPELNITEAFAACGMDYHGNYVRYFKRMVGRSPSAYRREILGS